MTKTLVNIQRQIEKLQKEADSLRVKEVGGVIERIKVAIEFYSLTVDDLFGVQPVKQKAKTKSAGGAAGAVAPKAPRKKRPSVIKYRDETGNTWTGNGKRPNWYKAAIESGKTAAELLIPA